MTMILQALAFGLTITALALGLIVLLLFILSLVMRVVSKRW